MRHLPLPDDDRHESVDEKMDRNFTELLQELRVLQTGTQILAGFLVTLPFQSRFTDLDAFLRGVFLAAIGLAFLTTLLLVAPVSLHRALFRQHRKDDLVRVADLLARVGMLTLGLTLTAVALLIVGFLVDTVVGLVVGALTFVAVLVLWWGLPVAVDRSVR